MQVKKFEAKTMREALKMIKDDLGPEAIILRVKDNSRRHGLLNHPTVEVTAAVTSNSLQKKNMVDRKFGKQAEKLSNGSASMQKDFIDKYVHQKIEEHKRKHSPVVQSSRSNIRYADMRDEEDLEIIEDRSGAAVVGRSAAKNRVGLPLRGETDTGLLARERIHEAARSAWDAVQQTFVEHSGGRKNEMVRVTPGPMGLPGVEIVDELRREISRLNNVVESLQKPAPHLGAFPGAIYGFPYELSYMFEKLVQMGFSEANTAEILRQAREEAPVAQMKRPALMKAWVAKYLLQKVEAVENPYDGWLHVFVGPGGSGKTTSLVKFCSHLVVQERKRVAVVTTDINKVGAAEQLKIYSQILNTPFGIVRDVRDWNDLQQELLNYDVVLVDTPGLQIKGNSEVEYLLEKLPPASFGAKVHYVTAATARDDEMLAAGRRYQFTQFRDVIFTNIDEAVHFGNIYNFQKEFKVPLCAFGMGPRIPEDLEPATRERYIDLVFRITGDKSSLSDGNVKEGVICVGR